MLTRFFLLLIAGVFAFNGPVAAQYLSDTDKYYKEIERYQREYDDSANTLLKRMGQRYFTRENAVAFLKSEMAKAYNFHLIKDSIDSYLDKYLSGLYPTRYQDPVHYVKYAEHIDNIHRTAKMLYPKSSFIPKFGSFYANSISAETKYFEQGYLILIHSKYQYFTNQMGKVALQFMKHTDIEKLLTTGPDTNYVTNIIKSDTSFKMRFVWTFIESIYKNFPPDDSLFAETAHWLRDKFIRQATHYWTEASEAFLIGHEYAHAMLKHRKGADRSSEFNTDTSILNDWINEVQADSVSQAILIKMITDKKGDSSMVPWSKYSMFGGLFFLNALKIFEEGFKIAETNEAVPPLSEKELGTIYHILTHKDDVAGNLRRMKTVNPYYRKLDHPPTEVRILLLQTYLIPHLSKNLFTIDMHNDVDKLGMRFANIVIFALNKMNELYTDVFYRMYNTDSPLKQKLRK